MHIFLFTLTVFNKVNTVSVGSVGCDREDCAYAFLGVFIGVGSAVLACAIVFVILGKYFKSNMLIIPENVIHLSQTI